MPHLPDTTTARTEQTMDQLRIPTLALEHIDRLRSEAERDRRGPLVERDDVRSTAERLGSRLGARRAVRQQVEAGPC